MRSLYIILISVLIWTSSVRAEILEKVKISGNTRVSNETVMIYGDIKINNNYTEKELNEVLNNLYSTNFFEDIKIKLNQGTLIIELVEYPVINSLIIIGEKTSKYKDEIIRIIKSKEKDSFIKKNLADDVKLIKNLYASIGYNFSEVDTKVRNIDSNNLDLVFEIKKGDKSKIKQITFTGDKKIREKRLRDVIASQEDKFWKVISRNTNFSKDLINLDVRLLKNYYKSRGFYDVNITSNSAEIKKSGDIEIIFSIDAGVRYIVKKILTDVDPVFDKNIFFPLEKEYKKFIGTYYSPFSTKTLLDDIDDLIAKNNLQFVEHSVEEIVENESITLKFKIFEGQKVLVERINILGNNVTNETVVRGELLIDEGDPFTNLKLQKSISNIKSRNIFASVKYEIKNGSEPNLKTVDIIVEEKPTGEISAGAGVGTNGGSLAFTVKENNWLGEGNSVTFDVEASTDSLRGTLNYTNPNYDFLGNSINYRISSISNDKPNQGYENTLIDTGVSTVFEQYKDLYASIGLSASHDDLKTDDGASKSLKKQSGQFSELSADYGFSYDKRNRSFMPTAGSIVSFNQSLPIYADKSFIANKLSASYYKEVKEDVIGATKFYFTTVHGLGDDDVRLSKRRKLGTARLRGFQKNKVGPVDGVDHIGGNYAAAVNFEANLPKLLPEATKTDIGLFLDFGNVWGVDYDGSIEDSNKIRSSAGAAASWISPIGPMTFILSTNISKASTDETESFNFNLGTTF